MPLYEYHCERCTSTFEFLRPMRASKDPADCPQCEAPAPRVLSVFAAYSGSSGQSAAPAPLAGMGGCGGCATGACACAH